MIALLLLIASPGPMVLLDGGRTTLGSPATEAGRGDDESPEIEVRLAPFAIETTPVTVAAFEAQAKAVKKRDPEARWWSEGETPAGWLGKCNLGSKRKDHPANCVDWRAARAYCALFHADLPSEAELEHAMRGGRARAAYAWGEAWDDKRAVSSVACGARGCAGGTKPVARADAKRCDARGLCDLTGQVWQWTRTDYQEQLGPYAASISGDAVPARPVIKGGSWLNEKAELFRPAHRGLAYEKNGLTGVGFRCVMRRPTTERKD